MREEDTFRQDIEAAHKLWDEIYNELTSENDRVAAIAALGYFEAALVEALDHKFIDLTENEREDLFERGTLQSFGAKISIAYALGILNKTSLNDLRKANKVRNRFAHTF